MYEVRIQPTEHPHTIRFETDYKMIEDQLEFNRNSDYTLAPIIKELFKFPLIKKIFITENYFAISKQENTSWEETPKAIKALLEDELLAYPHILIPKKKQQYTLYIEITPNPNVIKYVANRVLSEKPIEITRKANDGKIPLAHAILENLEYVEKVNIEDNHIALMRNRKALWGDVINETRDFIAQYLQAGNPILEEKISTTEKIEAVLKKYIFDSQNDSSEKCTLAGYNPETKTAQIRLLGVEDCISCQASVRSGIEAVLKMYLPEIIEHVEAVYE